MRHSIPDILTQAASWQRPAYQVIEWPNQVCITVKRVDQIHPLISGNKWFKLKYNLAEARRLGYSRLLSFGGAYSNHIHALANAAYEFGFESIGIIRGAELADKPLNPTLTAAQEVGMRLEFISRYDYRRKHTPEFLSGLKERYRDTYIIPEGGSNALAVKGCEEILSDQDRRDFDVIACAVGTGGTLAGLINASQAQQRLLGFSALKGSFLTETVGCWSAPTKKNWQIYSEDVFGGYGKVNDELLSFITQMRVEHNLPLEPIYTGKALYRLVNLILQNKVRADSRILFINTGGLQAWHS